MFPAEDVNSHGEQKSFREAILYDENGHVAITIWENLLEESSEEIMYLFQNIFLKDFYGLKLTITRATIVSSEVTTYMELNKQLKNCLHPKICCPEVVPVTLDVFLGCTNIACKRPVVVFPDQPSPSWQQYSTTMKVSKCSCLFHCSLTFEDMEKPLNLAPEVLKIYLKQDVIKLCSKENIKSFKDSLLFIDKVDYFYNYENLKTHMKKTLTDTIFVSKLYLYNLFFNDILYLYVQ